jgi:MORN repeat variant
VEPPQRTEQDNAAMKPYLLLFILPVFILGACKALSSVTNYGPPPCPAGSKAMGSPPPDGDETWCAKVVDGKPVKNGPFVLWRDSGLKMMQGYYTDGKQNGEWTMWYDNGQKRSVDHYVNGVQQGEHTSWYANGHIDAIGQYRDGKKVGTWKRWDAQGFRNWTETYKDGQRVS